MFTENDLYCQARQSGGESTTDWCSHYLSNLSISISSRVSVSLLSHLLAFALRYSAALEEAWPARTVPRFASHTLATPRIASIPIASCTSSCLARCIFRCANNTCVLLVMFKPGDRVRVNWCRKGKYYDGRIISEASGGYLVQYMDFPDEFEDKVRGEDIIGR